MTDAPELRIIDDALWQVVKTRQAALRHDPAASDLSFATLSAVQEQAAWSGAWQQTAPG